MGGRGASYGYSDNEKGKAKKYGTEYSTLAQMGNVKFVKYNLADEAKSPMETKTKGRVYATIDKDNDVKYISFYDSNGERIKQIDVKGKSHKELGVPHVHVGYEHDEHGTRSISEEEKKTVKHILDYWEKKRKTRIIK